MRKERIEGYHEMALEHIGNGQQIIDSLENSVEDEDKEAVKIVQNSLDRTAAILLTLSNAGATIQPELLDAFQALNRSVGELNEANGAILIETREIGDVPVGYGLEENTSSQQQGEYGTYGNQANATLHTPLMGETEDDNDCCGCCSVM
jgi:hypothetical protein